MNVVRSRTCCIWRTHTADTCTRVGFIIGSPSGVRKSCRFQISSAGRCDLYVSERRRRRRRRHRSTTPSTTSPQQPSGGWAGGRCSHRRRNPFELLRARARLPARANEVQFFYPSISIHTATLSRTSHLIGRLYTVCRRGGGGGDDIGPE